MKKIVLTGLMAVLSSWALAAVNINTATVEELDKGLDGIGAAKAKAIVDYRTQNKGFKSIDELKNVKGIGDKLFEKIKPQVTLTGKSASAPKAAAPAAKK